VVQLWCMCCRRPELTTCVVGGLLIRAALNTSLWNNAWSQHMVRERKKETEGGRGEREREGGGGDVFLRVNT